MIVAVLLCSSFHAAPTEWQLVVARQLTFAAWLARLEFTISSERCCDAIWRHSVTGMSERERKKCDLAKETMLDRLDSERRKPKSEVGKDQNIAERRVHAFRRHTVHLCHPLIKMTTSIISTWLSTKSELLLTMPVQSSLRPPHENRHPRSQAQHPHHHQYTYHLQSHNIPASHQRVSPPPHPHFHDPYPHLSRTTSSSPLETPQQPPPLRLKYIPTQP
jgi:hypothetical protein